MKLLAVLLFSLNFAHFAQAQGGEDPYAKLTPKQILASIYQPWSGPLKELERKLDSRRNYLVWIQVPAQHPLDLRSADYFRKWFLATPLTEFSISHNMVAFTCHTAAGEVVTGATGMTGQNASQQVGMILGGYGLSVLISNYMDGHLNPMTEVDEDITLNLKKRGAVFAGFEITSEQCENMRSFLSDFVYSPKKPYRRFGLLPDPEKMEGGGCVSFASALMNKAGVLEPIIPQFFSYGRVANYMIGGNLEKPVGVEVMPTPWLRGKRRSVSMNMMLSNFWDEAPPDFPGTTAVKVMDPEKMLYTLKQFSQVYLEQLSPSLRKKEARVFAASPLGDRVVTSADNKTVDRGLEFSYFPINDQFDPSMAKIGRSARAFFRQKIAEGYRIRHESAAGMPALLLERE